MFLPSFGTVTHKLHKISIDMPFSSDVTGYDSDVESLYRIWIHKMAWIYLQKLRIRVLERQTITVPKTLES